MGYNVAEAAKGSFVDAIYRRSPHDSGRAFSSCSATVQKGKIKICFSYESSDSLFSPKVQRQSPSPLGFWQPPSKVILDQTSPIFNHNSTTALVIFRVFNQWLRRTAALPTNQKLTVQASQSGGG